MSGVRPPLFYVPSMNEPNDCFDHARRRKSDSTFPNRTIPTSSSALEFPSSLSKSEVLRRRPPEIGPNFPDSSKPFFCFSLPFSTYVGIERETVGTPDLGSQLSELRVFLRPAPDVRVVNSSAVLEPISGPSLFVNLPLPRPASHPPSSFREFSAVSSILPQDLSSRTV